MPSVIFDEAEALLDPVSAIDGFMLAYLAICSRPTLKPRCHSRTTCHSITTVPLKYGGRDAAARQVS